MDTSINQNGSFEIVLRTRIRASKTNPRKIFDPKFLNDLAATIQSMGLASPILVRPVTPTKESPEDLEVVAGEQRYRATGIAKMTQIPVLIRALTDQQALEIQVIENLQRRDLHALEEAQGFEQLLKEFNYKKEDLAEKINKSKAYVYASLKLLDLCEAARKLFYNKSLTQSLAILIARIPGTKLQMEACADIAGSNGQDPMSQRSAVAHIQRKFMLKLKEAPFNIKDEKLLPKAGACTTCSKRTGNQPEIFSDIDSADVCTDTACFSQKRSAYSTIKLNKAQEAGQIVISDADAKKIFPSAYNSHNPQEGYKDPKNTCSEDPKHRTYGQIAKAGGINPVVVRNPHSGLVVELIRTDDIKSAMKDLGISTRTGSMSASEKESIQKAKAATILRTAIFTEVRSKVLSKGPGIDDWRMIASHILTRTENNTLRKLLKFLGWDISMATWEGKAAREEKIQSLSSGEIADVIFCSALFSSSQAAVYHNSEKIPKDLADAASRYAINIGEIEKSLKDAEKNTSRAKEIPKKTSGKKINSAVTKKIIPEKKPSKKLPATKSKPSVIVKGAAAWPFKPIIDKVKATQSINPKEKIPNIQEFKS